jgi:hypothetical protein
MSTRIATKGAIIKHGASATPTTTLAGVRSISVSDGARAMIDATCHDSATTKEYIPAPLRDTLGLTIVLAHDPADTGHEAIRAAYAAATPYYLTLVLPDAGAAQWALLGIITSFLSAQLNPDTGLLESTFTYKATASETFTQ